MKHISRIKALRRFISQGLVILIGISVLTGCSGLSYFGDYQEMGKVSSFNVLNGNEGPILAEAFANNLCIVEGNNYIELVSDMEQSTSAVLFDLNNKEAVYSKNPHLKLHPASLTKIMTALVAIKNGQPDQVLTATDAVVITEAGAQLAGIKPGDSMTLYQALRIMLLYSANDVANMIAENIGGSLEGFTAMMNEEALKLGATNSHFVNPNGLTDEEHFTTAYDLYLIFNECIKYDTFCEIISMPEYEAVYTNSKGNETKVSVKNTNNYVNGNFKAPANVTVVGGKTGTTMAAGHCLILLARNSSGSPFVSVILKSESSDSLYNDMNSLLQEVTGNNG